MPDLRVAPSALATVFLVALASAELRLALVQERAGAFAHVVGGERQCEALGLELQALVDAGFAALKHRIIIGEETCGAARFVYVDPSPDRKVIVDFNKGYNSPCAFIGFATCPLAPPENRLDMRVTAGEKKYAGAH